jgi:predicted Zn-dependent protease
MNEQIKKQFSEAVKFKEAGQLKAAKELLIDLAQQDPKSTAILAVLGDVYWDLEELEEAISTFRRAIEIAPTLEAVSLGLFHCLWKLERREEAMEEIKRFQTISDSEDYRQIVKEINEKFE